MEKLVIVGDNKKTINLICNEVKKVSPISEIEVISSLEDIMKKEDDAYKGFLIDFRSFLGCSVSHKIMTSVVEDIFPVAKFRVAKDNHIGLICSSPLFNDLESFLNEQVKGFGARKFRKFERILQQIPLKYSLDEGQTWIESVTHNISAHGIFLVSSDNLLVGKDLLVEFSNNKGIKKGKVKWVQPSPDNKKFPPGCGIEFLD